MMKIAFTALFLVLSVPWITHAKSCGEMTRELVRLRQEYHEYATRKLPESKEITFDGLTEILDKIVSVKNAMRKLDKCKIPPRRKDNQPEKR
ncbi:MAG: hypothetical protein HY914_17320 [Desulfomonile tiedjei]|nr:hypothetical protein [Desulfomonile tiedjei]